MSTNHTNGRWVNRVTDNEGVQILLVCDIVEDEINQLDYKTDAELRDRTLDRIVEDLKMPLGKARALYNIAVNSVMPYLQSGREILKTRAELDWLKGVGRQHLMGADGKPDPKIFACILQAIKIKSELQSKTQANLISLKRVKMEQKLLDEEKTNLPAMDRTQLEGFLKEKLLANPTVTAELIKARQADREAVTIIEFDQEI